MHGERSECANTEPVAIVDVHYGVDSAVAACVIAKAWSDAVPSEEQTVLVPSVQPYQPGAFFRRELPCVLEVLRLVSTEFRSILIDGYVELDERGTPGLGGHLHAHYHGACPVIGVAKTPYAGAAFAVQVFRGESRAPLFVTARGVHVVDAARVIEHMHGEYRIPTLIKRVDSLARGTRSVARP